MQNLAIRELPHPTQNRGKDGAPGHHSPFDNWRRGIPALHEKAAGPSVFGEQPRGLAAEPEGDVSIEQAFEKPCRQRFRKSVAADFRSAIIRMLSGSNSVVESRLPKPLVAGSIPVSRSIFVFLFSLSLATARNKGSVGIRKQFKKLPQVSAEQRGAEPGAPGRGPRLAQNDTLKITRQHTSSQ